MNGSHIAAYACVCVVAALSKEKSSSQSPEPIPSILKNAEFFFICCFARSTAACFFLSFFYPISFFSCCCMLECNTETEKLGDAQKSLFCFGVRVDLTAPDLVGTTGARFTAADATIITWKVCIR